MDILQVMARGNGLLCAILRSQVLRTKIPVLCSRQLGRLSAGIRLTNDLVLAVNVGKQC